MARIAGVDIPNNKKVEVGLTGIYGVGRETAKTILGVIGVDLSKRIGDLSEQNISEIRKYIEENLKVEGDLRKEISLNVKRLMEISCYRGQRQDAPALQRSEDQKQRKNKKRSRR